MARIPTDSDIPIYLAASLARAQRDRIPGRALVIVPDGRDWNDWR